MQCTARSRSTGNQCRQKARPGYKVCRYHGAGVIKRGTVPGRPPTHGRYSERLQSKLGELIDQFEADPEPLAVESELAAARALFTDFVKRYEDSRDALLAWYEDRGKSPPSQVLDVSDAIRHLEAIARVAQREKRVRAASAISERDLFRILSRQRQVLESHIRDPQLLESIIDDFRGISI